MKVFDETAKPGSMLPKKKENPFSIYTCLFVDNSLLKSLILPYQIFEETGEAWFCYAGGRWGGN